MARVLAVFIALILGAIFTRNLQAKGILMSSKRFQCYGVSTNLEISATISEVSYRLSWGADSTLLKDFLVNIAKAESRYGNVLYNPKRGYGLGVFQFDRAGWGRCIEYLNRKPELAKSLNLFLLNDYKSYKYEDLPTNIRLATAMARVYIYTIPHPLPANLTQQAEQWKKYYNTSAGKGTIQGFIDKAREPL